MLGSLSSVEAHCERCKTSRTLSIQNKLQELPPVLILHLKRFKCTTNQIYKLQNKVNFPIYDLHMRDQVACPQPDTCYDYDLFGVVNHFGTLGGGHYTSYVKNNENWFLYDDSAVTQVSENQVKTQAAYILFYKRKDLAGK